MKIKLLLFAFIASLVMVPNSIAKSASFSRGQEIKPEDKLKLNSEQKETRERITAIKRERIRNYFGKMIVRIEATIERLEKLIARIETRIKIINDNNDEINTTDIEKNVSESKEKLTEIKAKLSILSSKLETLLNSEKPGDEFKNVRESLGNIILDLKNVHRLLVQVVGDIKGLRIGDLNNEE